MILVLAIIPTCIKLVIVIITSNYKDKFFMCRLLSHTETWKHSFIRSFLRQQMRCGQHHTSASLPLGNKPRTPTNKIMGGPHSQV
jgi:hypothetical protein